MLAVGCFPQFPFFPSPDMPEPQQPQPALNDKWINKFLQHLATDRGASAYTQRNYRQAICEFHRWHQEERHQAPAWEQLQRDDFRAYVRFLGRHNLSRAATQLRFSALRTFYRFLIRHGTVATSPIKNLALPKIGKRLPKFLTPDQMATLLAAPLKLLPPPGRTRCQTGGSRFHLPARRSRARNHLLVRPPHQRALRAGCPGH